MIVIPKLTHMDMCKQRNQERRRQTEKGVVMEVIITANVVVCSV